MSWLEKILPKSKITTPRRHNIPEGVWTKCSACEQVLYRAEQIGRASCRERVSSPV